MDFSKQELNFLASLQVSSSHSFRFSARKHFPNIIHKSANYLQHIASVRYHNCSNINLQISLRKFIAVSWVWVKLVPCLVGFSSYGSLSLHHTSTCDVPINNFPINLHSAWLYRGSIWLYRRWKTRSCRVARSGCSRWSLASTAAGGRVIAHVPGISGSFVRFLCCLHFRHHTLAHLTDLQLEFALACEDGLVALLEKRGCLIWKRIPDAFRLVDMTCRKQ